jgi:hypothetical protein
VAWEHDTAVRWRPDASRESPVVIDPDVRLGAPSVGGISTNLVGAVRRRRRRPGSRQHLRTDPGTGALGTGVRGDSSSVSWAQAGGGPLLLRRRHVRSREPLVSGTSRLHLSWRPRWADQEAGAPPCAIKTPAGPDSEWSPTVANSAGSLSLETGTSKTELRIWSAVLMPSMRLCPGVQNSGSVPVRAAPRSRPDAKQADFLPRDGDPRARCRDPSPCVLSRTLPTGERLIAWGTLGNPSSNWQPSRFDPHPPSRPLVLRYVRPSETPRRPTIVFVINRVRDHSGLSSDRESEGYGRERQQRRQPGCPLR